MRLSVLLLAARRVGGRNRVVERVALDVEDLFELVLDVLKDGAEIEAVELLAPLLAELLEQVAQPVHAVAVRRAHAALHQVAQRVLQVTEVHQVVGQTLEHVVGVERRNLLSPIPLGVAKMCALSRRL